MTESLPHLNVFARLGASAIHGVGVIAICAIPKGTNVFASDRRAINWVDAGVLDRLTLTDAERQLYLDFGVRKGPMIGCPENFNLLSVGWYLNEPGPGTTANVAATHDLEMIATRDIATGEELTVDYALFSEPIGIRA